MLFAKRTECISPSLTRQLFDLAQKYDDVIDLTLGDPDVIPPQAIRDAACQAIQEGKTRYSANAGLYAVRKAVADFNSRNYGISIAPEEIMLTVGGMEAVYLSLFCIINPGDEVIIPAPYWINYAQMVKLCGGTPIIIPTSQEDDFALSPQKLESAITDKTKALIINTPNNPTGCVLSRDVLEQIAQIAVKHNLIVISDEVYQTLIYTETGHQSIFTCNGMHERTIVIDSMSKRFSMTGWRLGYAIAPRECVLNMAKFQENIASCAPLPSQYAALAAYTSKLDYKSMYDEFLQRRNLLLSEIQKIPKLSLKKIDATFYAFVNIERTGLNSLDFAMQLLQSQHVAVVPGRTYGEWYDDHIRIAFTLKSDKLSMAMKRLKNFIDTF